ncbi:VOC family protein [Hymenobacter psychrophilus]|uniref:Catechol 2,3-dioxygenase n=1 Tax=Hymenobacter psychrophilus TaxID=651662 RepID=A0A1H3F1Z8_9BACT|nr:VOC family protein [Hymenobacter psychrophilus]SDX84214.1 hypothetical protein SAMN04488069_103374 [Hymenobacter psychrophilus]
MKNAFWIALLLLLLGPVLTYAQDKTEQGFKAQRTILYPVRDSARLPAAITWYTDFFGVAPNIIKKDTLYPYALFEVDGITVRLDTDPKYSKLKETLFYWTLPTPEAVVAKLDSLSKSGDNIFNLRLFKKLRHFSSTKLPTRRSGTSKKKGKDSTVQGFIILDPEGNEVGVTNNPIYVPTY